MYIYFRVCEKEATISNVQRYEDYSKKTILRKSWASLKDQLTEHDKVIFIHDAVSDETLKWLDDNCNTLHEFIPVPEHTWEYHQHTVTLVEQLDKNIKDNLETHILIEDDYLFAPNALETSRSLQGLYGAFFLLYDYPDRYKEQKSCQVMTGITCHWRTVDSCTMTIGASAPVWQQVIPLLKEAAPTSNDKVFEEIFKQFPCISPLPGVASHMTAHHPTPYFNVAKRFNELTIT